MFRYTKQRSKYSIHESDACDTPIYATNWEAINDFLLDGCEVDDDRLPDTDNTPFNTGKTDKTVYK